MMIMNTNEDLRYLDEYLNSYKYLAYRTIKYKQDIITRFLNYINEKGEIKTIKEIDVTNYITFMQKQFNYKTTTINDYKTQLKLFLNWTFKQNITCFSGNKVCKNARIGYRENIITSYNALELKALLDSIDINCKIGKLRYALISIFVYYGMRVGDVVNLKFKNIDWQNNKISIIQQKTKQLLNLPLIDQVKYPLLDYIKNGRNNSIDKETIFIRFHKPYKKYTTSGIYDLLQKVFLDSKVNIKNKHHGSHAFRSSLATNMINNNASLGEVSQVLGHSTTKTTEQYVTKATTHLKELSLEVPYE